MAYFSRHVDKKTGAVYVYRCESRWDKALKAPRNRQVYVGKEDPKTHEIIPAAPKKAKKDALDGVSASCKIAGGTLLLQTIDERIGVTGLVRKCFGELSPKIMSLVYFLAQRGLPLSRIETWSAGHLHPFGDVITSQAVSELLDMVGPDAQQRFFSLWLKKACEREYLCYDIASVSSYASNIPYVKYGYNRDRESLPQINLAMLYGQKSMMPACFRRMPGNVSDVSTLKTTIRSLDFLGAAKLHFVLDRGFYSKANVDGAFETGTKVTVSLPSGLRWVERLIDRHVDRVRLPTDYLQLSEDEILFAKTEIYSWGEDRRRCYVHIFYGAAKAANDTEDMMRMGARLFIQFLALVFLNDIRQNIMDDRALKHMTVREVMEEMETVCRVTYANRYGQLYTEMNKGQRLIAEKFGVSIPTC